MNTSSSTVQPATCACGPMRECEPITVACRAVLRMTASASHVSFVAEAATWSGVQYPIESDRGYDSRGSMHAPAAFMLDLPVDQDVYVTASSEPWAHLDALSPEAAWHLELGRRERLIGASHPALQAADTFLLPLAADQFVIRPAAHDTDDSSAHDTDSNSALRRAPDAENCKARSARSRRGALRSAARTTRPAWRSRPFGM